jgi:hypothetical protein
MQESKANIHQEQDHRTGDSEEAVQPSHWGRKEQDVIFEMEKELIFCKSEQVWKYKGESYLCAKEVDDFFEDVDRSKKLFIQFSGYNRAHGYEVARSGTDVWIQGSSRHGGPDRVLYIVDTYRCFRDDIDHMQSTLVLHGTWVCLLQEDEVEEEEETFPF